MDEDFWREKWRANQLGWHQSRAHPMLVRHLPALRLQPGARVFVPLCGKTLDINWLLGEGFRIAGAELVEHAVQALFDDLKVAPTIRDDWPLKHYGGAGIDIFVGDLFDLGSEALGEVDAVYDRAALVALPAEMRPAYAAHVAGITACAPQLLITFDYDQNLMEGPPFSVDGDEVRGLYAATHDVTQLESADVEGGLKGFCPATETAWSLETRA